VCQAGITTNDSVNYSVIYIKDFRRGERLARVDAHEHTRAIYGVPRARRSARYGLRNTRERQSTTYTRVIARSREPGSMITYSQERSLLSGIPVRTRDGGGIVKMLVA
jgi:hypothetical protein